MDKEKGDNDKTPLVSSQQEKFQSPGASSSLSESITSHQG